MPAGGTVRRGSPGTNRDGGTAVGWPVDCVQTCAGFGARLFRAGRCRRHDTVWVAAAGIAARRARRAGGQTRGSGGRGVGAGAEKIVCHFGTIGFGARQVRTGQ